MGGGVEVLIRCMRKRAELEVSFCAGMLLLPCSAHPALTMTTRYERSACARAFSMRRKWRCRLVMLTSLCSSSCQKDLMAAMASL